MRNVIDQREVETSGLTESATFTFAAGAKAFKIFIDGIYSDKIRAIIREYWTNAYDAHALVGKLDIPFKCQLPTVFNPELIIRDFGPSISHEVMLRVFTKAFLSSKDDSDEFVGSLGLGRLSAFSYTDSFNVTTYLNKEKRDYVVFLNTNSIPELSLMSVTGTEEVDGFEVRFPVKTSDCFNFRRAAEFTSIGFTTKPIIANEEFTFPEIKMESSNWSICSYLTGAYAKQGCVIYPIDKSIMQELGNFEAILETKGLIIDFPIGSLEFSASRESLGYNEETRNNLKKVFTNIIGTMIADVEAELSKAKTWAGAALIIQRFKKNGLHSSLIKKLRFKGLAMVTSKEIINSTLKSHGVCLYTHSPKYNAKRFSLEYAPTVDYIPADTRIVYAAKHGTPSITPRVIMNFRKVGGDHVYIIHYADARGLERMRRIMGYPEVVHVETLPKPPVAPRQKRDATEVGYVRCFIPNESTNNPSFVEGETFIKDGGYYLTIDRGALEDFSSSVITALMLKLKELGNPILDDLVAINPSQVARFEKNGWKKANEIIRETVTTIFNKVEYQHDLFYCNSSHSEYFFNDYEALSKMDFKGVLGSNHPLTNIVEKGLKIEEKVNKKYSNLRDILRLSNVDIEALEPQESIDQKASIELLLLEFPMLKLMDNVEEIFKGRSYRINNPERLEILLDYLKKEEYEDIQLTLAA